MKRSPYGQRRSGRGNPAPTGQGRDVGSVQSAMVIDCGSTATRAHLIGQVDSQYRLLARGEARCTMEPPWRDLMVSVRQAVYQVAEVTGRHLLDGQGQIISPEYEGTGVDVVVAVTSASDPLRLVLAGAGSRVGKPSLAKARFTLPTDCVAVEEIMAPSPSQLKRHLDDVAGQVRLIHELMPDAILLLSSPDGDESEGLLHLVRTLALAYLADADADQGRLGAQARQRRDAAPVLQHGSHPHLIYAGDPTLLPQITPTLVGWSIGSSADLYVVDDVHSSQEQEVDRSLQGVIERLHRQQKMERLPGFGTLASWSTTPVQTTARAFGRTVQFLAQANGGTVLGVDLGAKTTTLALAAGDRLDLAVHGDLGIGLSAARILDQVQVESVLCWLPFELSAAAIRNALHNRALRPHTLPQTSQDLSLDQAVARAILRLIMADVDHCFISANTSFVKPPLHPRAPNLIIGSGSVLTKAPHPAQAALVLLDGLQPVGISALALDLDGLAAACGALATLNPLAATQVMDHDTLVHLGTVVAPVGAGLPRPHSVGKTALSCGIEYSDGRSLNLDVAYGSIHVLPLAAGHTAKLRVRPSHGFDLDVGWAGHREGVEVGGGSLGIVIDARGRPLPLDKDPATQRERVRRWHWEIGA